MNIYFGVKFDGETEEQTKNRACTAKAARRCCDLTPRRASRRARCCQVGVVSRYVDAFEARATTRVIRKITGQVSHARLAYGRRPLPRPKSLGDTLPFSYFTIFI